MTFRQAFIALLHALVLTAFLAGGLFFVSLPHFPILKEVIELHSLQIGIALFGAALILWMAFFSVNRGRYLRVRMGSEVNVQIIRMTVEECFKTYFPKKISLNEIDIPKGDRIEIGVTLGKDLDEAMLKEVENKLQTLLYQRFGYSKPFHFTIT